MAKALRKAKKRLENRQKWYDAQNQQYKAAHKRPGSMKKVY